MFCFSDLSFNNIQNIPKELFVDVKKLRMLWVWQAFIVVYTIIHILANHRNIEWISFDSSRGFKV